MIIDADILEMDAAALEIEYRKHADLCASLDLEDKQALVQALRLWSVRTSRIEKAADAAIEDENEKSDRS